MYFTSITILGYTELKEERKIPNGFKIMLLND